MKKPLIIAVIITASAIIGGLGVFWSNNAVKKGSAQILDLMAQVQTQGLDSMFSEIEHASIVLGYQVSENLTDSMIHRAFCGTKRTENLFRIL